MNNIIIKIIDTNLDNDLVSFEIDGKKTFCISKNHSSSLKEFIENVFSISLNAITSDTSSLYDIINIDAFSDEPIDYDSMNNSIYIIEFIKKERPKVINYEVIL